METRLAITSLRATRAFAEAAVPPAIERVVLDAGRLTGSGMNRQPWRFIVVRDELVAARLAPATHSPGMLVRAPLRVAVVTHGRGLALLDCGRAAQNMLLAGWDAGLVSCPTGIADADRARAALDLPEGESVALVLCLGLPVAPRDPARRSPDEWSRRARRHPLAEIVEERPPVAG